MTSLFTFKTLITPKIIPIFYWLGLIANAIGAFKIASMFGGVGLFAGIASFIFGFISIRIGCELLIVLFRINESLKTVETLKLSETLQDKG
ncbi:DUF4282 domain-containing protein [Alkalimarinus alittae]|uniref:DUF4282 domain-containing protein n=1 Tax=Alkalimarinus alittae TaxID=2961619 RepID=A0ABY6N565_9ALTE|nr:DUF4282 domain-containing protein [Alkalimarinus alittae]UZE97180.1 DUF4282 domain-containing protein [Alkalimarinus alittae]